jgi:signal transduction histidine kinase
MRILMLIALLAGVAAVIRRGVAAPSGRVPSGSWLPDAVRALARAGDPRVIADVLARELARGVDAAHVAWWRRQEDGSYRSELGRVAGADAAALDRWVADGAPWQRATSSADGAAVESARLLADTGAALVVPLALDGQPIGLLAIGPRRSGRPYRPADVAAVDALGRHFALVAERVQAAALLEESRRMVQQATRLSTVGTLAAELAHEIRNPLVAVQTFLQILPERLDDPEVTVDLRGVALTELQRVARLLNELLGMARASVSAFAATDLEAVVEQVVRLLQVSARKKDVGLERHGDRLPTGAADASRLKQALVNLVLNAIQASPTGTTVVVTTLNGVDAGRPFVEITIRDEGPGIPEDQRDAVFHPFFTTKDSGTGLGLPVTRQIVADHGGTIGIEGAPGEGARFVVRLPLAAPTSERRDQAA